MVEFFSQVDTAGLWIFSFPWDEALGWLSFSLTLALYFLLVWHFYHLLAKRDTFHKDIMHYDPGMAGLFEMIFHAGLKIIKYGVLFPLVSFLWFVGFSVLLFVVAQNQPVQQIALVAIGLISAARILAYYNETIASEFSQTLPIVILSVFLIEPGSFNPDLIAQRVSEIPALGPILFQFVLYLSLLELGLRFLLVVRQRVIGHPGSTAGKK